jgi:glycosyltransferase involved in cell wall biosynthesis
VLTSSRSRRLVEEDDDGVLVVRAPEFGRVGSAPIAPGLAKHVTRLAPDLVHFHMPNPTAEISYLAARLDVPAVATYHAEVARARWLVPPYHLLQRRFLSRMRRVMVGSAALAAHTPLLRAVRNKVAIVPFGTDPAQWAERPPRADEIRARYRGPLILFAGRLVHYKGVHDLLDAMRQVDGTLVLVGWGGEIPALLDTAKRTGLEDRVVFAGPVDNAERAAYYHAADVLVLPSTSRSEGFGLVLLEAMACGTPVAAYPVRGPIDVVKDPSAGVLDADLGAAAMAALTLDRDKVRRYAERYSWEHCSRQFVANLVPARVREGRLAQAA